MQPLPQETGVSIASGNHAVCNFIEQLRLLSVNTLDKPTKLSA
jgi:hypothetical protein